MAMSARDSAHSRDLQSWRGYHGRQVDDFFAIGSWTSDSLTRSFAYQQAITRAPDVLTALKKNPMF